jgi:transcriptional regulator with XRE-family HTH domain
MGFAGHNLKKCRQEAELTQQGLADMMGTTRLQIWKYENGRRTPRLARLQKMAEIVGVRVDDLLDNRDVPDVQ